MKTTLCALFEVDKRRATKRIYRALVATKGKVTEAADELGLSYRTLHRLLHRYRLESMPSRVRAGVK